ncbi:hypothetical protein [Richelia sinica]|jgi:small-conductance mechanosensitive channel|uniref:hypothetical protein n=1 Tax=Richelia sinica TaxID=1357545 RepID=UPI0016872954|nr:hypothetical protein [Richelia sinica]MBD2665931.1 hypothetical protein [Richelia sinica FACHB-800]
MSNDQNLPSADLPSKLQAIASSVQDAAQACQGDIIAILSLLRQLERLHREIRDGVFQENLPDNRQRLYSLLRDIESEGGWPYIERMKLQAFLNNLLTEESEKNDLTSHNHHNLRPDDSLGW